MSVLRDPTVRPNAVAAVTRFVAQCGDAGCTLDELVVWAEDPAREEGGSARSICESLLGVASSLDLVRQGENGRWFGTAGDLAVSEEAVWNRAHKAFLTEDSEQEVLDAYASLIVAVEVVGPGVLSQRARDIADLLRHALSQPDNKGRTGTFNDTRWDVWVRWMTALGLGFPGPRGIVPFLPVPARRIQAVLQGWGPGELEAREFLQRLGQELPYLDGGTRYQVALRRERGRPAGDHVSWALTQALRQLHREGRIQLRFEGGDREAAVPLYRDGLEPAAVASVIIPEDGRGQE
ncbi:hypothetical protein [Deferrisoma palaeochoriense]